jgi:GT2 family glycosyltransferase
VSGPSERPASQPDERPQDLAQAEAAALRAALESSERARRQSERDLSELLERRSVRFARALSAGQQRLAGVWRLTRGTGKPASERIRLARGLLRQVGPRRFLKLLASWSRPEETRPAPIPAEADAPPPRIPSAEEAPWISVLVPVCDPEPDHLRAALASLAAQTFRGFELILIDDASRDPEVLAVLADARGSLVRRETRSGISRALNAGLAEARGEWICVLDHDDTLSRHALAWLALRAEEVPEADLIYSDEDKLDPEGGRVEPFYKPQWSPDLLLSINYLCHLCALRRSLVEEVGGFRPETDGAQDYDLFLRTAPRARRIEHVPRILYHWRQAPGSTARDPDAKPYAVRAGQRALEDARASWGLGERSVTPLPRGGYRLGGSEGSWRVTILIATRDRPDLLQPCLESVRRETQHERVEILIVDNGSETPAGRAALQAAEEAGARVLSRPGTFNFGWLMNEGAAAAGGEVLLFLNDDTEVRTPGWIQELLAHLDRPGVGAVGPLLRYPNGRIQHAGVLLGVGGAASHAFIGRSDPSHPRARLAGNVSALTGACLALRREAFEAVGGFAAERLPNSYGDVDLCLQLWEAGWRCVFVPSVELLHHEGATRGHAVDLVAEAALRARWGHLLDADPYGHPLIATTDLTPDW